MDRVLLSMAVLTLCGYVVLGLLHPARAGAGLELSTEMFGQALPWMIVSMFAAGFIAQVFQPAAVARLLGKESGLPGILLGASLGLAGTGSRWAAYPLVAGLFAEGAGPGPMFAFLTSWQLLSLSRLPAEVPFLGLRFTVVRAGVSFVLAVIGGMLVNLWYG